LARPDANFCSDSIISPVEEADLQPAEDRVEQEDRKQEEVRQNEEIVGQLLAQGFPPAALIRLPWRPAVAWWMWSWFSYSGFIPPV
jgi:hypothetical protein